jgi:S1-C subfamily serine protease
MQRNSSFIMVTRVQQAVLRVPILCAILDLVSGGKYGISSRRSNTGVIFNMILAFLVTIAQVNDVGYADATYKEGVRVPTVMQGSAAQRYGIQPGDLILALDGEKIAPGVSP